MDTPVALALTSLVAAAASDARSRRIPNGFNAAVAVAGVSGALVFGWSGGLIGSLSGSALGLAVGLSLVATRVVGAGDAKLLAGVGALVGFPRIVGLMEFFALGLGLVSVWYLARGSRLLATVRGLISLVTLGDVRGFRGTLMSPTMVPVAVGMALGGIAWALVAVR